MPDPRPNVVLIGMPGAGKSTVGVLLAKVMSLGFLDTDVYIQAREGRRLQEVLDEVGPETFCRLEAGYVREIGVAETVIATGGSVVYGDPAMAHLAEGGVIVHLDIGLDALRRRLGSMAERGVVMGPGQDLGDLYAERMPLYRRWADVTVSCEGRGHDENVQAVRQALDGWTMERVRRRRRHTPRE